MIYSTRGLLQEFTQYAHGDILLLYYSLSGEQIIVQRFTTSHSQKHGPVETCFGELARKNVRNGQKVSRNRPKTSLSNRIVIRFIYL